jgi:hypothetical protein
MTYLNAYIPADSYPAIYPQQPQVFEANLVAKMGDAVTATFFTEKIEQIPLLIKSLFERVQKGGAGRAKAEIFCNPIKPFSLVNYGVCIKIQTQVRSDCNNRFILAEVKIFSDEFERMISSSNNTGLTTWFGTARRIEQLLNTIALTDFENLPWTNTATSFTQFYEDVNQITPMFKTICTEVASGANCTVGFEPQEKEIATRKALLLKAKDKSNPVGSTMLKVIGIFACILCITIAVKFFDPQGIQEKIQLNNPNVSQAVPCECLCPFTPLSNNSGVPVNISSSTNAIAQNATALPNSTCRPIVSAYEIEILGDCTREEINSAYEEHKLMSSANDKKNIKDANESTEALFKIEQAKLDVLKANKDAWINSWNERVRKLTNPTPEELAELYAEIDCELDKRFRGWPGYVSTCPTSSSIDLADDCKVFKSQFNKLALLYHSDKNSSPEAVDKFNEARNAYETLCPRNPQKTREPDPDPNPDALD